MSKKKKKSKREKDIFDEDMSAQELEEIEDDEEYEECVEDDVQQELEEKAEKKPKKQKTQKQKLAEFSKFMSSKNDQKNGLFSGKKKKSKSKKPSSKSSDVSLALYRKIALGFIFVTGALLIFMLVFSSASATVSMVSKKEQISVSLLRTVGGVTDRIEGEVFVEDVSYSETFSVEEGKKVEGFATGEMKIINNSGSSISLIARTRFQSESGVIFRISDRVTVDAGSSKVVFVKSDVKGEQGEVDKGRFIIPGLPKAQQDEVYGESPSPMKGGVRIAGIVTESDILKAKETTKKNLKKNKLSEYREKTANTFTDSIAGFELSIDDVSVEIGDEVDSFDVSISGTFTAVFFDADTLDTLTRQAVFAKVPTDKRLHTVGDVRYEIDNVDFDGKTATLKLIRGGEVVLDPNAQVVDPSRFTDKTEEEIGVYLDSAGIFESYEVKIRPRWRSQAPSSVDRIEVELK